jgi:hypothetical protein
MTNIESAALFTALAQATKGGGWWSDGGRI